MPEHTHDGTIVLSCQGLPFAVAGVGDLLALFRCVSVRYRFSTDVMKPTLMGAIGRVYSTLEPEMSHNVQKYDKQVYLRVSEAQRCRVHSTMMVPIFGSDSRDSPLAVFELVQGDRDVTFPAVLSHLSSALQGVHLFTVDMETAAVAAGLRKWPMHIDSGPSANEFGGAVRLSPGGDQHRRIGSATRIQELGEDKEPEASSNMMNTEEKHNSPSTSRQDEVGTWAIKRPSHGSLTRLPGAGGLSLMPGAMQLSSSPQFPGTIAAAVAAAGAAQPESSSMLPPGGAGSGQLPGMGPGPGPGSAPVPVKAEAVSQLFGGAQSSGGGSGVNSGGGAGASVQTLAGLAGLPGGQALVGPGGPVAGVGLPGSIDSGNPAQLMSWLNSQGQGNNTALVGQLRMLLEQHQAQQQQQQAQGQVQQQQQPQQLPPPQQLQQQGLQQVSPDGQTPPGQGNLSSSPSKPGSGLQQQGSAEVTPPIPVFSTAAGAAIAIDKPGKLSRSGSQPRALAAAAAAADEGDGEDISSDGDDDDDDDDDERGGSNRNNNRVGGGAGKRLRFEDLQAQFGLGLKEAANNLGICATTLKRACRRHGIKRWPRRQIAKLSKALNQMGYSGTPPPALVQNAVVAAGGAPTAAPKPKPVKKPDPVAIQQATQLILQQQLAAATAAANGNGGGAPVVIQMMVNGTLQSVSVPSNMAAMHQAALLAGLSAQQAAGQAQQAQQQLAPGVAQPGMPQAMQQQPGMPQPGLFGGYSLQQLLAQQQAGQQGAQQGPGGPQGAAILIGGMNGGMGPMGLAGMQGMQPGIQAGGLGIQLGSNGTSATGMAPMAMHGQMGAQMQAAMLHPVLGGGAGNAFAMQHALLQQQQQQQQQFQQQQQQAQHAQQQAQHQQQQQLQQQHHQQQQAAQQQAQQQAMNPHQQQQQMQQQGGMNGMHGLTGPGAGGGEMAWMSSASSHGDLGKACGGQGPGGGGMAGGSAMDMGANTIAPRMSCGEAPSPFGGLGMSPGLSDLPDVPEDFIGQLNGAMLPGAGGGGGSSMHVFSRSSGMGAGVELMDLLGDDLAAR